MSKKIIFETMENTAIISDGGMAFLQTILNKFKNKKRRSIITSEEHEENLLTLAKLGSQFEYTNNTSEYGTMAISAIMKTAKEYVYILMNGRDYSCMMVDKKVIKSLKDRNITVKIIVAGYLFEENKKALQTFIQKF